MGDAPAEQGVPGRFRLVHVGIEVIARQRRKLLDVRDGHLALARLQRVSQFQIIERNAEWMPAGVAQPAAAHPLPGDRGEGVWRALHGGALHVAQHPANAANFLTAPGAAWAAMDQRRKRRSMSRGLLRAGTVYDQYAAMVRRETEHDSAGKGIIGREYRGRQTALAAAGERDRIGGIEVRQHRCDGAEGLDFVDRACRAWIAGEQQERRKESTA